VCKAGGQRRKKRKDTTAAAASEKRETSPVEEENSTPHIQRLSFRLTLTDSLSHLSLFHSQTLEEGRDLRSIL